MTARYLVRHPPRRPEDGRTFTALHYLLAKPESNGALSVSPMIFLRCRPTLVASEICSAKEKRALTAILVPAAVMGFCREELVTLRTPVRAIYCRARSDAVRRNHKPITTPAIRAAMTRDPKLVASHRFQIEHLVELHAGSELRHGALWLYFGASGISFRRPCFARGAGVSFLPLRIPRVRIPWMLVSGGF
jgi:hypothetical protein